MSVAFSPSSSWATACRPSFSLTKPLSSGRAKPLREPEKPAHSSRDSVGAANTSEGPSEEPIMRLTIARRRCRPEQPPSGGLFGEATPPSPPRTSQCRPAKHRLCGCSPILTVPRVRSSQSLASASLSRVGQPFARRCLITNRAGARLGQPSLRLRPNARDGGSGTPYGVAHVVSGQRISTTRRRMTGLLTWIGSPWARALSSAHL
jgi:hypothetical protein